MLSKAVEIDSIQPHSIKYSICTLVSNLKEYEEMLFSFKNAGFEEQFCEFLYIDNSNHNKYDAYSGISKFLAKATGKYIILCHQDVLINFDNEKKLSKCIDEINTLDLNWGILGNAGGIDIKTNIYKIAYPDGKIIDNQPLPRKVATLDENFLVLRKDANIGISQDLSGFHFYGTDLCLISTAIGCNNYVIDFLLTHKSYGNPDKRFYLLKEDLIHKYQKAFKSRYLRTTITTLFISGSSYKSQFFNTKFATKIVKFITKIKKAL